MKSEDILSILQGMTIDELVIWFNYWLDHYGTKYRCTIIRADDEKAFNEMQQQMKADNVDFCGTFKDYVYYDYEGDTVGTFTTTVECLNYFDIVNFIVMFEDENTFDYDSIFGWMN